MHRSSSVFTCCCWSTMSKKKMEVEVSPLRSLDDFLLESARFQIPNFKDFEKWGNRVINNLLYYQTNYFLLAVIIFVLVGWVIAIVISLLGWKLYISFWNRCLIGTLLCINLQCTFKCELWFKFFFARLLLGSWICHNQLRSHLLFICTCQRLLHYWPRLMSWLIKITAMWDVRLYSLVIPISNCWQWRIKNRIYVMLMVVVKIIIGWMGREMGVAKVIYVASFWGWHCLYMPGKHHKWLCNIVWSMTYWFKGAVVGNIKTWFGFLFFNSLSSHMSN